MTPPPAGRPGAGARCLMALVRVYQLIPRGVPRCRFAPTCSSYALQALREHGALRGVWLAARRVSRCHPFHPGGIDPVPTRGERRARRTDEGVTA